MATVEVPPLLAILAEVPDVRQKQGKRHPLAGMLVLSCVALLCGYESISAIAEWGENYGEKYQAELGFERHGYPAIATWYRVLGQMEVERLNTQIGRWCERVLQALPASEDPEGISIDGKTLRGSRKQGAENSHLLAAVGQRLGSVLGQVAVSDHSNEIGSMEELLLGLVLRGRLVTTDALLTQKEVAQTIVDRGGDYLLPVKHNQELTYQALEYWFDGQPPREFANRVAEVVEKGHGRLSHWRIETTTLLNDYLDWPQVGQSFKLTCRTILLKTGEVRRETHYGLTSLPPDTPPTCLLAYKRRHWTIENRFHWVRDVVFAEDRSQLRVGHAPHVMATLRNLVIALLRAIGRHQIAAARRYFAAHPDQALHLLIRPLPFGE